MAKKKRPSAARKADQQPEAVPETAPKEAVSKADAYRTAEKALGKGVELEAVRQYILDTFGIEMPKNQISTYRSLEKQRAGKKGKRGRKPAEQPKAAPAAVAPAEAPKPRSPKLDDLVEFVSEVRGWEARIGEEQVKAVIDALYRGR
jgi:hypothetical protein